MIDMIVMKLGSQLKCAAELSGETEPVRHETSICAVGCLGSYLPR